MIRIVVFGTIFNIEEGKIHPRPSRIDIKGTGVFFFNITYNNRSSSLNQNAK